MTSDFIRAQIGAEQLLEIGLPNLAANKSRDMVRMRVATWLAEGLHAFKEVPEPTRRSYFGDLVAKLGDPRFDSQRFCLPADDLLGFVRIPADLQYRIGTRRADAHRVAKITHYPIPAHEANDLVTPTPDFYIARYPVTIAQFRAFVEASGFNMAAENALSAPDNRPVCYVNWHDALAYCNWLNQMLTTSPLLAGSKITRLVRERGWRVTLPSELEWEKAARGEQPDAIFSWGDTRDPTRANYNETTIGDTAAVGCFPVNGFGLNDMLGNAWQWTRSLWCDGFDPSDRRLENLMAGNNVARVLRGGSWRNDCDSARCACRSAFYPNDRTNNIGFRVMLRSVG